MPTLSLLTKTTDEKKICFLQPEALGGKIAEVCQVLRGLSVFLGLNDDITGLQ